MEERLFGSVDVQQTLDIGNVVFTPGILASANRGMLCVDDINLLGPEIVMPMLQAITDGFVSVEREGLSVRYPCHTMLVATFNEDDADFKDTYKDRIGISLSTDDFQLNVQQRTQVARQVSVIVYILMNIMLHSSECLGKFIY